MDVPCAVVVLPTTRPFRSVEGPARWRLPEAPLVGTVDDTWRLAEVSLDAAAWFGLHPEECPRRALHTLVHPDDAPALLLAAGRSRVVGRGVPVGIRVRRHDGAWTPVRCEISPLCGHNPPRFALAMWAPEPALPHDLSRRQLEILRRLVRGERVPTIALELSVSQSTVRGHLSAIYRSLGVHSQSELLARLMANGVAATGRRA
jgi:DNA-binding CsgD family transcriptional regulator